MIAADPHFGVTQSSDKHTKLVRLLACTKGTVTYQALARNISILHLNLSQHVSGRDLGLTNETATK